MTVIGTNTQTNTHAKRKEGMVGIQPSELGSILRNDMLKTV